MVGKRRRHKSLSQYRERKRVAQFTRRLRQQYERDQIRYGNVAALGDISSQETPTPASS